MIFNLIKRFVHLNRKKVPDNDVTLYSNTVNRSPRNADVSFHLWRASSLPKRLYHNIEGALLVTKPWIQHFTDRQSWLNDYKCLKNALYGYFCGHMINICPQPILSIGKTMIKRETDVEVVSKATTNQRIGRTNVQVVFFLIFFWMSHTLPFSLSLYLVGLEVLLGSFCPLWFSSSACWGHQFAHPPFQICIVFGFLLIPQSNTSVNQTSVVRTPGAPVPLGFHSICCAVVCNSFQNHILVCTQGLNGFNPHALLKQWLPHYIILSGILTHIPLNVPPPSYVYIPSTFTFIMKYHFGRK